TLFGSLLAEVAGADEPAPGETGDSGSDTAEADDEPTAEHPVIEETFTPVRELTQVGGDWTELRLADDTDSGPGTPEPAGRPAPQAGVAGEELALEAEADEATGEFTELTAPEAGTAGEELALEAEADEATGEFTELTAPVPEERAETERLIDEELLRASGAGHALSDSGARAAHPPAHVETIVMEGERVQSSLHGELVVPMPGEEEAPPEAPPAAGHRSLRDTYLRL